MPNGVFAKAVPSVISLRRWDEGDLMNSPDDSSNVLKEKKDVWLGLYQEDRNHVRHLEAQRATASNIIVVTTAALIGVMATDDLTCKDWPVSVGLIILGLYGAMFTAVHYESISYYRRRAGEHCDELEALVRERKALKKVQTQQPTEPPLDPDECEYEERLPKLRGMPSLAMLRAFWPLTISIIGIALTAYIAIFLWGTWDCRCGA